MSILARLFILIVIAVLPALLIEAYNQVDLRREREQEVHQNALRLARFAAGELDRIIENGAGLLAALSQLPAVRNRDAAACSAYFAELKALFSQYMIIGATNANGDVFCASRELPPGFTLHGRPVWQEAIKTGKFTVGAYHVGPAAKTPILPLVLAFHDPAGATDGLVFASLDLLWLAEYFTAKQFDENATITITDSDTTILLRLPENERFLGTQLSSAPDPAHLHATEPGTDEMTGLDGVRRILGYVPVNYPSPPGLFVGIALKRDAAFASIDRATRVAIALLTGGFVMALAAAWIGGRRFISLPITRLAAAAGHWQRGDFGVRVEPRGGGEIAVLGNAFNEMAAQLARKQTENAALLGALAQRVSERAQELALEVEERRKAEAALVQSQKMEALGQLTGGIAHDFNNLLAAVIGNLELAEMRLERSGSDPGLRKNLAHAHRSAERGAELTRDLLAFARRQSLHVEAIDLNTVVRGADDLLRRTVGPPIQIDHRLAPQLWQALADRSQMELVILNLSLNARDAMPGGGTITIETANLAGNDPRRPTDVPDGDYVLLAISDTGTGMTQEVLAKCLEPFFTTKEVGKGSGLGLSVVHGIAKQSGGTVEIASELGHGTSVRVYLPRAFASRASIESTVQSPPAALPQAAIAANVLLVDDDPDVREAIAAQLRELGCRVVEVSSGGAALDLIEGHESLAFDLLISDYAMPGLNGTALARAVRERCPDLPVMLITGYTDVVADTRFGEDWMWLFKPFRQAELAEHIRRALAGTKSKAEPIA